MKSPEGQKYRNNVRGRGRLTPLQHIPHGGASTGPRTQQGLERIRQARAKHGPIQLRRERPENFSACCARRQHNFWRPSNGNMSSCAFCKRGRPHKALGQRPSMLV